MYQTLLLDRQDRVAIITLNRPKSLNAYTVQMGEDLVHAFAALRDDDQVRVVVLTGAGKAFCAGVDLKLLRGETEAEQTAGLPALGEELFVQRFAEDLYHYPKPIIAALNGAAVGVGITMCLPVDIRLAAADAKLALPFARLGIVPGFGSSYLLPRLVGAGNARMLTLTGSAVDAETALAMGLIDRLVPRDALLAEALELAATIAANPPQVLALIKQALNAGTAAQSIGEAIAFEHDCNARRD